MSSQDSANGRNTAELPLFTTRRMVQTAVVVLLLLGGIYFLFPKLVGLGDALSKLGDADPVWIAVAIGFNVVAFCTYIALFKAVVGGDALPLAWKETYEINMAGVAATRLFSAGGAGGIALTYWALRKAGMRRRDVGRRMVAFLSLQYVFYPIALIVFGVLLRTGVLPGKDSVELTVIPAAVAGFLLLVGLLIAFIPPDLGGAPAPSPGGAEQGDRRQPRQSAGPRRRGAEVHGGSCRPPLPQRAGGGRRRRRTGPPTSASSGPPSRPSACTCRWPSSSRASSSAWSPTSFPRPGGGGRRRRRDDRRLRPLRHSRGTVFPAILIYRLVAFWMPIPFGTVAFLQLRKTVGRWEVEGLPIDRRDTIKSKVIDFQAAKNG